MKKLVLITAGLGFGFAALAQKSQIRSANNYIGEKNYEKAKAAIEAAVKDESTKDDPYAWFTRGNVYLAMQQEPANADKELYNEAGKSFKKAISLESGYRKEEMNNKLFAVAIYNFNTGLAAFDKQEYDKAFQSFGEVVSIHDLEGGKRFDGKTWTKFDTISQQARLYQGYAAYYSNKYDEALPLLVASKDNPVAKNANIYLMLADIYESRNDDAAFMATVTEGKAAFPQESVIANRELNYLIKNKRTGELITKLEDAIKADPSNPQLVYNLALTYDNMANPKDDQGKDLPKPSNYDELFKKAETGYLDVLKASDDAGYNYSLGALYFNRAVVVNEEMNEIPGNTNAELKKYDALKVQRDEWFNKALPYFEKTVTMLEPQVATLKGEDKKSYLNAIVAAKEIYAKQNKLDKATEFKKKLEAAQ